MECFCSNCGSTDVTEYDGIWICNSCGYAENFLADEEDVVFEDEEFYIEEEWD